MWSADEADGSSDSEAEANQFIRDGGSTDGDTSTTLRVFILFDQFLVAFLLLSPFLFGDVVVIVVWFRPLEIGFVVFVAF